MGRGDNRRTRKIRRKRAQRRLKLRMKNKIEAGKAAKKNRPASMASLANENTQSSPIRRAATPEEN